MKTTTFIIVCLFSTGRAFSPRKFTTRCTSSIAPLWMAELSDLSDHEQGVYNLVLELHACKFPFRIVVVGDGAILETTSTLGPHMMTNKSPKSGEYLITLANEDKSFEFHLKPNQVSKVVLTEKATLPGAGPGMKIFRFIDGQNVSICSLILCEKTATGSSWFEGMVAKYGQEVLF